MIPMSLAKHLTWAIMFIPRCSSHSCLDPTSWGKAGRIYDLARMCCQKLQHSTTKEPVGQKYR
jgi:hypothetical protein